MMVIAPLLDQQGLNLTVPENVAQEQVKKDTKILTVSVTAEDKYFINGEEIQVSDLEKTIAQMAKDYPDGMMIESDGDATTGAVVKLMDSARNSGKTSISVSQV